MRFLEEGMVRTGNVIERETVDSENMIMRQLTKLLIFGRNNHEDAKKAAIRHMLTLSWKE